MEQGITPRAYAEHLGSEEGPLQARTARDAATVDLHEPSPIIGVAAHHSHRVREPIREQMAINESDRLLEEDPYTERFLAATTHRLTPNQSRYEVDVNRPPHLAVYTSPEMAWGSTVWQAPPSQETIETTLERWYEFHAVLDRAVEHAIDAYGRAIVLDVHSFNYRREENIDWRASGKPVVNLGTRYLQLDETTRDLKDAFLDELDAMTLLGEDILVEENSVFYGGYLNRRLSRTYASACLTLSVEFKKVFMDERTGELYPKALADLLEQFHAIVHRLAERVDAPVLEEPQPPATVGSYTPSAGPSATDGPQP